MKFYSIKNWDRYQHYKIKNGEKPAWLKLHKSLLDDYEFHALPVEARALLPLLWLLAGENDGKIDNDIRKISFRLRQSAQEIEDSINTLVSRGFLDVEDDSRPAIESVYNESTAYSIGEGKKEVERQEQEDAPAKDAFVEMQFETFFRAYPGFNKGKISDGQKGTKEKARREFRRAALIETPEKITEQALAYGTFLKKTNDIAKSAHNWLSERGWDTNYGLRDGTGRTPMPSPAGG